MEKNSITGLGPAEPTEPANVEAAIKNFEANGFTVKHFATGEEAAAYLDKEMSGPDLQQAGYLHETGKADERGDRSDRRTYGILMAALRFFHGFFGRIMIQ